MKPVQKAKDMFERAERVNAIKAMKKAQRTPEQQAELKQWNKEAIRNTAILYAGIGATAAINHFARKKTH